MIILTIFGTTEQLILIHNMFSKQEIKLKISKKTIKKLEELKGKETLEEFLENQILEMAIAKEFEQSIRIAQQQIEAIQKGLKEKKEQLKNSLK